MEIGKGQNMNIKVIGAILAICACGSCGFITAAHHASQIRLFQNLMHAVEFMICELQYRATSLPLLCRQTGDQCNGKIRQIFLTLSDELEAQVSPNVGLCMASALDKLSDIDEALSTVCMELGNQLGRFDLPGQIRGLESCVKSLSTKLEQLNKNKESRLRSYQTLGLCAGAAVAILFV